MINTNEKTGLPYGVAHGQDFYPEVQAQFHMLASTAATTRLVQDEKGRLIGELQQVCIDVLIDARLQSEIEDLAESIIERLDLPTEEPCGEIVYEGVRLQISWLGGSMLVYSLDGPAVFGKEFCSPCVPSAVNLTPGFASANLTPGFTFDSDSDHTIECHGFKPEWMAGDVPVVGDARPEYTCPKCGGHTLNLEYSATARVEFFPGGQHDSETVEGDITWDDDTEAQCECGHQARLRAFKS